MPSSGVQTCARSEEHTSELQSHDNLVCRLLLEKKKLPRDHTHTCPPPHDPALVRTHARCAHTRCGAAAASLCGLEYVGVSVVVLFFFFKEPAPPQVPPFSPTAPLRI